MNTFIAPAADNVVCYSLLRGTVVERRCLTGELSQPWLDLQLTGKSSATGQPTRPTHHFIFSGSLNE